MISLMITFILYFSIVPFRIRLIYEKQKYFSDIYTFLKKIYTIRFVSKNREI